MTDEPALLIDSNAFLYGDRLVRLVTASTLTFCSIDMELRISIGRVITGFGFLGAVIVGRLNFCKFS